MTVWWNIAWAADRCPVIGSERKLLLHRTDALCLLFIPTSFSIRIQYQQVGLGLSTWWSLWYWPEFLSSTVVKCLSSNNPCTCAQYFQESSWLCGSSRYLIGHCGGNLWQTLYECLTVDTLTRMTAVFCSPLSSTNMWVRFESFNYPMKGITAGGLFLKRLVPHFSKKKP